MGRPVMLSNGEMLIGLDERGLVHDFYYPYVGLDNLTTARSMHHKIGVWVDNKFSWLDSDEWMIMSDFEEDALVSKITAENRLLGITLQFADFVDAKENAFCRIVDVINTNGSVKDVRVFFHQVFQISRAGRADTALYVPEENYIFDYKGHVSLLIYARIRGGSEFDQFAVGNYGIESKEGTYRDAEDGELSNNLVEHGGVDSVIRCSMRVEAGATQTLEYHIIVDSSQYDAEAIHKKFVKQGLDHRLHLTRLFWRHWLSPAHAEITKTDQKYQAMFKKSLLVIKAHIDKRGGLIASCDSSIYNYGRDYYSYVWPRDGALSMLPLIELGYQTEPKNFFEFCADTIHPRGYMMHKYQPDRSIGSTWHPLMHEHHPELAIQEDETAAVVYSLGRYYQVSGDKEFVASLYERLIAPAADFMAGFIDDETNLPHASYDLWEQTFATFTYTSAITIGALRLASIMAKDLEHTDQAATWRAAAQRISDGMRLLYDTDKRAYRKSLYLNASGDLIFDPTIDSSSAYGVWRFDETRLGSDAVAQAVATTEAALLNQSPSGGAIRYEQDDYFLSRREYKGNPWIICTLWLAQYHAKRGNQARAIEALDWTMSHASNSGMLSEQLDPQDAMAVGVSPLVWSHAEFINTVLAINTHD